jgi:hypothetical protein
MTVLDCYLLSSSRVVVMSGVKWVVWRITQFAALFFIALGVFFAASKFNVPWYGSNDFRHYSVMVELPFSNDVRAPFGYRIVTPTLAHVVWRSGVFYQPSTTPFKDKFLVYQGVKYSSDILNALIFTNFFLLVAAAFFLIASLKGSAADRDQRLSPIAETMLGSMVFLSFSTVVFGFAGITEGGTLFFVSLLLYLHRAQMLGWFFVVILVSAFQRELISVVMFVYLVTLGARENRSYLAAALLSFSVYLIARSWIALPGHEDQLQLSSYFENVQNFSVDRDFFLQVIIAQNLVWAFLIILFFWQRESLPAFIPYFSVIAVLLTLSIGADIGPNAGRILNIALPIFLLTLGNLMVKC